MCEYIPELNSCRMTDFSHPPPDFLIFWSKDDTFKKLGRNPVSSVFTDDRALSICELTHVNQFLHLLIVDSSAEHFSTSPSNTDSITIDAKCLKGWIKSGISVCILLQFWHLKTLSLYVATVLSSLIMLRFLLLLTLSSPLQTGQ